MTIEEMHYYVNEQLQSADNTDYQQLLVPQIDFILNQAEDTYVKMIAFPLYNPLPKFELNSRVKNNIHTLVVSGKTRDTNVVKYDESNYLYKLPADCNFFVGGVVIANNGSCYKELEMIPVMHETTTSKDYTIKSSFLWEECNYLLIDEGVKLIDVDDFTVTAVKPHYIKKSRYMHFASKHSTSGYKDINGKQLTGKVDSELPDNSHQDIVNIAVLLIKSNLNMSLDTQIAKLRDIN